MVEFDQNTIHRKNNTTEEDIF